LTVYDSRLGSGDLDVIAYIVTYKRVVYSAHAARRLRERSITRAMVRKVLAVGDSFDVSSSSGKNRRGREYHFGGRLLRVVYVESSQDHLVITAMWKD